MAFTSTSSSVSEGVGTTSLTVSIADFSTTQATTVDVAIFSGSAARVNGYTTQTLTFPTNNGSNQSQTITVTNNSACDGNAVITFRLQNITGGQGTPFIPVSTRDHALTITDNDVCTGVSFDVTSATVSEGVGTYNVQVNISDFSTTQATTVDVALTTGSASRINNYTTQTVTFPANSGTPQNVTITVTENGSCDGTAVLNFGLENLTGGQGTPFVGPNSTRSLTVTDNDAIAGEVIARQAFDGLGTDTWGISANSGTISTNAGATDLPANSRILSGTASWQVNNATSVLDLATVDVSGYSNLVVTVRVSATTTSGTNGLDAADSVKVFAALDGAAFSGIADLAVRGQGNARWSYAGTQTASTTAGVPVVVQSPTGTGNVNGPGTLTISLPNGTQTLALRVRGRNNDGTEIFSIEDIQVTGDRCNAIYYSRADGNVGDAIWSDSPSGSAGSVTFDRFKSMRIQNGDVVNLNANTRINDFTVDAGGQLDLAANTLTMSGDVFDNNGTVTAADNSTIVLNSAALTTVESTTPLDLFNLTANTPGDVLTDATIAIRGTLQLQDGEFDASLGAVTLSSTTSGTGRLGPVAAAASYTGNLTVERYIPAGATNWRFLGSPVAGQTVNEWKDDFITAGFPGSHAPTFSNPVGSGNLWPSIRWYDETKTFANIDTGWVGVSNITQTLDVGQGFAAWCGTGLNTTTAFTVDVTGAPHIALTPITRNLSYTNTGAPTIDGWNAVSNPLPSPILFSNITRTNAEDYVYIFNPALGNVAVWDISLNTGTNNGTDTVQSSQAFMVQAMGASASVAFEEADKVLDRQGGFFGGSEISTLNGVRLKLTSGINTFSDEALVIFGTGENGVDGDDIPKLTFAHPDAPQIATMSGTNLFAINAAGTYTSTLEIPVMVNAAINGTYTVTASSMENIGLTCLVLEDLETGILTPLVEGASYSFTMAADASATEPRLMLRASVPVPFTATGANCNGAANGQAEVQHTGATAMEVTWTNAAGDMLGMETITAGASVIEELPAGDYAVSVSSEAGCGALSTTFTIEEPAALEVSADQTMASCPNSADGVVDLLVLGGTAPYSITWSNGSTDEDLVAGAGTYTVSIVDDRGCTMIAPEFTIAAGPGPVAMAEVPVGTNLVNAPVAFVNNSVDGDSYTWDFGDGQTSTEFAPAHSWSEPGTYTVTLTVDDGTCTDIWTAEVIVETSTAVNGVITQLGLNAWFALDKFVVEHHFSNGQPVVIEVLDATGRLHATRKVAGTPARVNVPADNFSTGIWFVRISNNGETRTVRVPLVR